MKTHNPLGKQSSYSNNYDKTLLFPINRQEYRSHISAKFESGHDSWTCFEFSWLSSTGVPEIGILQIVLPASSKNIVESKSLKLYLGGFSGERYSSVQELKQVLKRDLSEAIQSDSVAINLYPPREWRQLCRISEPPGENIDTLITECTTYDYSPNILKNRNLAPKNEVLVHSNLFRSLCPVTSQPDWATVIIEAEGGVWDYPSLGQYLVSFRNHNGFHEHCCETIMNDLLANCRPEFLAVECRFTRRGGIDINPMRTTDPLKRSALLKPYDPKVVNLNRFARQ